MEKSFKLYDRHFKVPTKLLWVKFELTDCCVELSHLVSQEEHRVYPISSHAPLAQEIKFQTSNLYSHTRHEARCAQAKTTHFPIVYFSLASASYLSSSPVKKSNKQRASATWVKIPRDVKTAAAMRGVDHFGAALMDGKAAECTGSSRSDGHACIRRSQLARAVAAGALRPARVVLNAGGEWGDLSAHNVLPHAPWKTTADRRGAGK